MNAKEVCEQVTCCQIVRDNPMIGILICDDDLVFLERMHTFVAAFFRSKNIKVKIYTYLDAQKISPQIYKSVDIALLDVDFENECYNGMDIARLLRTYRKDSVIIFVTNFIEYAPEGYEVQAFRYILKRQLDSDLFQYLTLAISQLKCVRDTIKFQVNGEIFDVPLVDVLYLEVCQHNVTIFLKTGQSSKPHKAYSFYATLTDLEVQLSNRGFLRIHKSYLVNMQHITKFQCREVILSNGRSLRVSEKNYAENKKKYLLWKGWQE